MALAPVVQSCCCLSCSFSKEASVVAVEVEEREGEEEVVCEHS